MECHRTGNYILSESNFKTMINNLFFNLIIAHILGDFYIQWSSSCRNKVLYSVKGMDLWLHSLVIGILSWIAIWDLRGLWLAACIMVSHFLIDWLKSHLQLKCKIYKISNSNCTYRWILQRLFLMLEGRERQAGRCSSCAGAVPQLIKDAWRM